MALMFEYIQVAFFAKALHNIHNLTRILIDEYGEYTEVLNSLRPGDAYMRR